MSEYMEKFSVSRLIGAPPGYVGYEDSGTLTKAVRRKPYSVVLLDEIEKAHPDVFNILLQVLDEGHLTDNYGRVIDFKNTVVIMTSNVGARDITKGKGARLRRAGRARNFERIQEKVKEEIQHVFNPEFLNRLDDVIVFHPLAKEHIAQIVGILLKDVQKRLVEEELTLRLTEPATDFLVSTGYDEQFGARPLKRAIQRYIEDPLSEKILLGEFSKGDEIEVGCCAGQCEARVPRPDEHDRVSASASRTVAERPDRRPEWAIRPLSVYITAMFPTSPCCSRLGTRRALRCTPRTRPAQCARPDSIVVRGNERATASTILGDAGLVPGDTLNSVRLQRAIKSRSSPPASSTTCSSPAPDGRPGRRCSRSP